MLLGWYLAFVRVFYAEHGILSVRPYYGPWSWMNREARANALKQRGMNVSYHEIPGMGHGPVPEAISETEAGVSVFFDARLG